MNAEAEQFLNEMYQEHGPDDWKNLIVNVPYNDALDHTRSLCVIAARDADELFERTHWNTDKSSCGSIAEGTLEVMFSLPGFTLLHYMEDSLRSYVELLIHFFFKKCGDQLTKEERGKCLDAVIGAWEVFMCDGQTSSCATINSLIAWICDDTKPDYCEQCQKKLSDSDLVEEEWIEDRRAGKGISHRIHS